MNNLIPVSYNDERITVSARNLWEGLDKPYDQFTKWFDKYKEYGFIENEDYRELSIKILSSNRAKHDAIDYEITLEMAKELAMLQKSPQGSQYRKYFIDLEKKWNSPEQIMERALKIARQKVIEAERKLEIENKAKKQSWSSKGGITANRNFYKQKTNVLTNENEALREELGRCKEYATITAVQRYIKADYQWKKLKDYCTAKELEIIKVLDPRWGTANSYPAKAWYDVYNIDLEDLF